METSFRFFQGASRRTSSWCHCRPSSSFSGQGRRRRPLRISSLARAQGGRKLRWAAACTHPWPSWWDGAHGPGLMDQDSLPPYYPSVDLMVRESSVIPCSPDYGYCIDCLFISSTDRVLEDVWLTNMVMVKSGDVHSWWVACDRGARRGEGGSLVGDLFAGNYMALKVMPSDPGPFLFLFWFVIAN